MRRVPGLAALSPGAFRSPVATLGMFDGVHVGHRAVLAETVALARERAGEPVAVTFDVHPRAVVAGAGPPLLTSLEHRLRLLDRAGVAAAVVLHFDAALRDVPAEEFLRGILVARMGVAGVVLGPDSHYGKDRSGDTETARRLLAPLGIPVRGVDPITVGGAAVSSTAIREALRRGDLPAAAGLLGRPVSALGLVVRGDGRGRSLGFPTANLDLEGALAPPRGVYAALATPDGGSTHRALVNVGGRPTFLPAGSPEAVEVWLDGFDGDLYGLRVEVAFHARLRDERRFDGPDALRRAIGADRDAMLEFFRRESLGPASPGDAECIERRAVGSQGPMPTRKDGGQR